MDGLKRMYKERRLIRLLYYLPMERMTKEEKVHLEGAKVYGPQDYEVVDELKKLKEENKKLKEELETATKCSSQEEGKLRNLEKENKKLKERINTMQEFIDYSGGIVQNAIGMLYEEGGEDKALDYLENCYAIGDEGLYEEMEKIYKDEE